MQRAAKALRSGWGVTAIALLAIVALGAGLEVLANRRHADRWLHGAADPSMAAISALVAKGDVAQAARRISAIYRFDRPVGLLALQRFSLLVLARGLQQKDVFERCYAASALAGGGNDQGLQMLVNIFQRNPDLSVKMAIADGLGADGDRKAVAILAHLYYHGEVLDRRFIVNALSMSSDPSAAAVLSDAARQSDPTLRAAALQGLGHLGHRNAIPLLRLALAKGQTSDKVNAARSLLLMGDSSGIDLLRDTLDDHSQGNARASAAVALGYAGDRSVVPILRRALADENIDVRLGAAAALTHYKDSGAVAYLRGAIHDQDQVTRRHAAQLFKDLDFAMARPILIEALSSPDPEIQLAAVKAFGTDGSDRDVELLGRLLRTTNDPITRAAIAWSLGHIASPDGIATLLTMVTETSPTVRYTAADGLDYAARHLLSKRAAQQQLIQSVKSNFR